MNLLCYLCLYPQSWWRNFPGSLLLTDWMWNLWRSSRYGFQGRQHQGRQTGQRHLWRRLWKIRSSRIHNCKQVSSVVVVVVGFVRLSHLKRLLPPVYTVFEVIHQWWLYGAVSFPLAQKSDVPIFFFNWSSVIDIICHQMFTSISSSSFHVNISLFFPLPNSYFTNLCFKDSNI